MLVKKRNFSEKTVNTTVLYSNSTLPMNIKKISVVVCIYCFLSNNLLFAGPFFPKPVVVPIKETECQKEEFENFKNLLKDKSKDLSEDFFVITVTREGKDSLSQAEIQFYQLLLKLLLGNKKIDYTDEMNSIVDNIKNESQQSNKDVLEKRFRHIFDQMHLFVTSPSDPFSDTKNSQTSQSLANMADAFCIEKNQKLTSNEIVKILKNSCGLVAFSEYFFSGKKPLDHSDAERYSKDFSAINKHYLFACNFLTSSNCLPDSKEIEDNIVIFNREIDKNKEIVQLMNKREYQEASKKLNEVLVTTEITEHLDQTVSRTCMENKTFYALDGKIVSTYNKSSYADENDAFLRNNKAFYKFGDRKDHAKEGYEAIEKNISTEICLDIGARKDNGAVNIHLIQSNVLYEKNVSAEKMPPAWCYVLCDADTARRLSNNKGRPYVCTKSFDVFHKKEPICSFLIKAKHKIAIDIYKIERD